MYLSYNSPCEIQGTLFLKRDPFMYGLGFYEDINGETWDIHGAIKIEKEQFVQARRLSESESYYGTALWDSCAGSHSWKPYLVKIVNGEKMMNKPKIYLAGTKSEFQYRKFIKETYSEKLTFIDPFEIELNQNSIVKNDLQLIDNSDLLVAYITKITVGTTMEIMYACRKGIPTYVITNDVFKEDPWLKYYSSKFFNSFAECMMGVMERFGLLNIEKEQIINENRHKCEKIIKRNYFEGEEMEEKKNMNMGEIANAGFTKDDSLTSTRLLQKSWSPMIVRKYYVADWPCWIGIISDCNLNDLDQVVLNAIEEGDKLGFLDGNIQSCRNFCGFMSDKIDEHYSNIKRGSVEGLAVAWYVDKMFISSLKKDEMVHKSCRDEFYSIIKVLPHI